MQEMLLLGEENWQGSPEAFAERFLSPGDQPDYQLKSRALEEAIEQLQSQNRDLLEFSHIVSHNLSGPLSNLQGLSQLLQSEPDPLEAQSLWAGLDRSLELLHLTVTELRDLLKLREESPPESEVVALEPLPQEQLLGFGPLLQESQIHIDYDFSAQPELNAIPVYLRSILHNLLENALKYRSYDLPLQIEICSFHNAQQEGLSVRDNGRGIDLKQLDQRIFRLYQCFHPDVPGRGLGLYMCRLQAEAMGGELKVDSEPEQGACFQLYLPRNSI